ncbi:MAG: 1-acyl-sn-glycerol-3-phosphate acyltransferase, partial [Planctomycetes bacterium]|nr:1-acyl-sn-glycerol-3-phosphate acyltransferase [Planctomycetota bacterium]
MRVSYGMLRFVSQWIFVLYGRGRVFGLEHFPASGGILLACNHQSFLDPVIVALPLPREAHFMARDTLFRNRPFRAFITHLNAFPVRRDTADIAAIKRCLRVLKSGEIVIAFPEGTRTRDGSINDLRPGLIAIAKKARCVILPTILEGAFEIWPRKQALPGPAPLWIEYGRPISADQLAAMELDEATRHLTARLRTMHNTLRERIGRSRFEYGPESHEA